MNTLEDRLRAALAAKSDRITEAMLDRQLPALDPDTTPVLLLPPVPHHPARRSRGLAAAALAVAAMLLLAIGGVALHRAQTAHRLEPAQVRPRSAIPWSQVGADWTLTVTAPTTSVNGTLYLVDPSGLRYLISSLPSQFLLVDRWSLGVGRVLVTKAGSHSKDSNDVLLVDLRTGSQRRLAVPFNYNRVQFIDANQHLILANSPFQMLAITDTGQRVSNFPGSQFWGSVVSADGSQVVAGSSAGLTVFDTATGRRIRTLAPPPGYRDCAAEYGASSDSDVTGSCYSRTQDNVVADFSFSLTNSHPPVSEPVPPGWSTVSFARGVVAIEHNTTGSYEPRDVRFARLTAPGRLVPLTLPKQLQQVGWSITSVGVDSFLLERTVGDRDQTLVELGRWNPLTGSFASLFASAGSNQRLSSYAGWQAAPLL